MFHSIFLYLNHLNRIEPENRIDPEFLTGLNRTCRPGGHNISSGWGRSPNGMSGSHGRNAGAGQSPVGPTFCLKMKIRKF